PGVVIVAQLIVEILVRGIGWVHGLSAAWIHHIQNTLRIPSDVFRQKVCQTAVRWLRNAQSRIGGVTYPVAYFCQAGICCNADFSSRGDVKENANAGEQEKSKQAEQQCGAALGNSLRLCCSQSHWFSLAVAERNVRAVWPAPASVSKLRLILTVAMLRAAGSVGAATGTWFPPLS